MIITKQMAHDIAVSALNLQTELNRQHFPAIGNLLQAAMPAIVQVACSGPEAPPADLPDAGPRDRTLADTEPGPCAATQAYGAAGCT